MGSVGISNSGSEPIAIVGLSCKFAGDAESSEAFRTLLTEAKSAWTEIPSSRFNVNGAYHPNPERLSTVRVHWSVKKRLSELAE